MFWSIAQVIADLITKKIISRAKKLEIEELLYKAKVNPKDLYDKNGKLSAKATKLLANKKLLLFQYKKHNQYIDEESGKFNMFSNELSPIKETNALKEYKMLNNQISEQKNILDFIWKYVKRKISSLLRSVIMPGIIQTVYWLKNDFLTEKNETKYNALIYPWYSKLPKSAQVFINKNNSVWSNKRVYKDLQDVVKNSNNPQEYEKNVRDFINKNRTKFKKMYKEQVKKDMKNWDRLDPNAKKSMTEIAKKDNNSKLYQLPIKLLWVRLTPETGGKMKGFLPKQAWYNLSNQECPISFGATTFLYSSKVYNLEVPPGIEQTSTRTLIITLSGKSFESKITSIRWA